MKTNDDQLFLIDELKQENAEHKKERDEFTERKLMYRRSFKQYEETKDMEEERNNLRDRIIKLEQELSISKTSDAVKHSTINKEDQQNQIAAKYQEKESASCDSCICMNSPSTQVDSDNSVDAIKENTHEMKPVDSKIDDFKNVYYLKIILSNKN